MPLQSTLLTFWQCYLYLVFLIPLCFNLIAAINVLQYIHVMLDSSIIWPCG